MARGSKPHVPACALCHLVSGGGHPESASVAGLSADYIVAQMHAFRDETALLLLIVVAAFVYGFVILLLFGRGWLFSLFRDRQPPKSR